MTGHSTEPYQPVFTGETKARLEALATKYPNRQALLLPSLWMVQEARGWVAPEAIHEIAGELGITAAYIRGVVSFYTMYHTHPVGKYFIRSAPRRPATSAARKGSSRRSSSTPGAANWAPRRQTVASPWPRRSALVPAPSTRRS
jgi:hypothetical protein